MIDVINSKENGADRNIQLVIETHSEHFLRRMQRRIAEDVVPQEKVSAYFANIAKTPATLEPLQIDIFGTIKNWPENFFGDEMGDITEQAKAAMKKRMNKAQAIRRHPNESAEKMSCGYQCSKDGQPCHCPKRGPSELTGCVLACVEAIEHVIRKRGLVIDAGDEIFDEYRQQLSIKGQPGVGDRFMKWVHDNRWSLPESDRVAITKMAAYDQFPDHKGLSDSTNLIGSL